MPGWREVATRYRAVLDDSRSRDVASQAIDYLTELFATAESLAARMAGEAEGKAGNPKLVAASASALVGDLVAAVRPR